MSETVFNPSCEAISKATSSPAIMIPKPTPPSLAIINNCRKEAAQLVPPYPTFYQSFQQCDVSSAPANLYTGSETVDCPKDVSFVPVDVFVEVVKRFDEESADSDCISDRCIMLDCRENRLYQNSHIKHSISASCHSKIMAKRSIALWLSLYPFSERGLQVYIYDQKSDLDQGISNSHLQFFIDYLQRNGHHVTVLNGGFDRFKAEMGNDAELLLESCMSKDLLEKYTFSPTNKSSASEDILNAGLSQITENIWIGNERCAHDWELLQSNRITHILNVTNDVPNYYEKKRRLTYCRLSASDNQMQDIFVFFEVALKFIEQAVRENGRVLVHCWAGVSRSPTIVLAYLIHSKGWTVATALQFVQKQRPVIAPNVNFLGQLERFYNLCAKHKKTKDVSEKCKAVDTSKLAAAVLRPEQVSSATNSLPTNKLTEIRKEKCSSFVTKCQLRRGTSGGTSLSLELPPPGMVPDLAGSVAIKDTPPQFNLIV